MTLAVLALGAMIGLRLLVLALILLKRHAAEGPAYLPPIDQWPALLPFIAGEVPIFLGLLHWLRTGSVWAMGIAVLLAAAGIAQGVVTARRDGVTLLHADVPLAALLLFGLVLALLATRAS